MAPTILDSNRSVAGPDAVAVAVVNISGQANASNDEQEHDPRIPAQSYEPLLKTLIVVFYALVILAGFSLNVVLSYLIFTRKFMRVKYIFTVSISIVHCLTSVVMLPLIITYYFTNDTRLERPCQVIACCSVGVTSYSMLTTAVRRFLALSERFRYTDFTYRGKVTNVICVWLLSLCLALPFILSEKSGMFDLLPNRSKSTSENDAIFKRVIISNDLTTYTYKAKSRVKLQYEHTTDLFTKNEYDSTFSTTDAISDKNVTVIETEIASVNDVTKRALWVYSVILFFVLLLIPTIISIILQLLARAAIKRRPNQTHWMKELQIAKQHICMLTIYFVCWGPLMALNLFHFEHVPRVAVLFLQPLAGSSVIYFPILYYLLNAHIHREIVIWARKVTE